MGKTVLASKFTEWRGLDRVSQVVHAMNCIFRELSKDDFGLDGEIEVVRPKSGGTGFETTGGIIKVQAKAGASYVVSDTPPPRSPPRSRRPTSSTGTGRPAPSPSSTSSTTRPTTSSTSAK